MVSLVSVAIPLLPAIRSSPSKPDTTRLSTAAELNTAPPGEKVAT
jgi:hypothetical protein